MGVLIHQAQTAENHSNKFFVQPSKELGENLKIVRRFSDYSCRESAIPKHSTDFGSDPTTTHTLITDSMTVELAVFIETQRLASGGFRCSD